MMKKMLICAAMLLVTACGDSPDKRDPGKAIAVAENIKPDAAAIALAEELAPDDTALAAKYDRSCRSCHSLVDSGAPLTGHKQAWDGRFKTKNMETLLANTKAGLAAMPAMGLCNDCSDVEFTGLINFMAGRAE